MSVLKNVGIVMLVVVMGLVGIMSASFILMIIRWTRSAQPSMVQQPINLAAVQPPRPPRPDEKIVARLINAVNHDMRSIELGQWFLAQLRALRAPCDERARAVELQLIARRVPDSTSITQTEIYGHLKTLAAMLCAKGKTPQGFVQAVDTLDEAAFGPNGMLRGMPGYATKSRLELPSIAPRTAGPGEYEGFEALPRGAAWH